MNMQKFGNCCTAQIIEDVQGYDDPNTGTQGTWNDAGEYVELDTYEKYKSNYAVPELRKVLTEREDYEKRVRPVRNGYKGNLENLALVFLTVNAYQNWARQFFKEVGFRSTKKTAKGAHPERELYGMFGDGETLQAWLDANRN